MTITPVQKAHRIAGLRGDRDNLMELLHVSLRKLADSKITSAMWNALHVVDNDTRRWFCGVVSKALESKTFATDVELVRTLKEEFRDDEDAFGKYQRMMITCMLATFEHNDWLGLLGYIIMWPEDLPVESRGILGKMVKANHPITCLNPDEWFEVINAREDEGAVYVIGRKTFWFRLSQCEVQE